MGIDLQSPYLLADGVEEPQSQLERHQAQWAQWNIGLGLARKIGFPEIGSQQNLTQQGTLPTLELSEEPKRMPYLEDESTRYEDGTPKPGTRRVLNDSDSNRYEDGTPKPARFLKR